VKLFRDPDEESVVVERRMLNPLAGEEVVFMHSRQLVCEVDKECYVPDEGATEVTVQLPFAEERYDGTDVSLM
jgi:hypothetical protein